MREKGLSPSPRLSGEVLRETGEKMLALLGAYLLELDTWFREVRDFYPKVQTFSQSLEVTSVGANTTSEQAFTVSGLSTSDIVTVNKPSHHVGLGVVNCRVSAKNTLAITYQNTTAGAIDPAAETYLIVSIRR